VSRRAPTLVSPITVPPGRVIRRHAQAQLLELLRTPVALLTNTMYPTLAFLFFILPQQRIISDTGQSLVAAAQLALFGVMSSFVFGYGIGAAQDRLSPWTTYLRTLPAGALATTVARFAVAFVAVGLSLVPLVACVALFTAAPAAFFEGQLPWWRPLLATLVVLVGGLPFLGMAVAIGYSMSPRSALAVAQLVTFPLAFIGGLMFPPDTFPGWADLVSLGTPARAARDLTVATLLGQPIGASTVPVFLLWTAAMVGLAVWANRRDEGRRFR